MKSSPYDMMDVLLRIRKKYSMIYTIKNIERRNGFEDFSGRGYYWRNWN